jgi:S-adenosylmethionine:tRNA ribosyltransferase-isomerase
VVNDTKVMPARLVSEGVEILLLARKEGDIWEALVKPGRKAREGAVLRFGDGLLVGQVLTVQEDGNRLIRFDYDGIFEEILDELGQMPLPPYIREKLVDKDRYQTVYARAAGSAAASTAGLHFTEDLLAKLADKGVKMATITLNIGLGTFRPVKTDKIEEHGMHAEFFVLDAAQAEIINETRHAGGRIVAVGTSAVRTLETCTDESGILRANSGYTTMFIYPGHNFKAIDGLITNFHLPESTLIMLVSALAGRENILAAYQEAINQKYRFYSFGDAMLIL